MIAPEFLTLDDALALHADRIDCYGGSSGLRDLAGLQSALGMPSATFDGKFLELNDHELVADPDELYDHVIGVASGTLTIARLTTATIPT